MKVCGYEIYGELGAGTAGTSFLARDEHGKTVVARRLDDALAAEAACCTKFLASSEQSAKIRMKKHVAIIVGQARIEQTCFLLREYVIGTPLASFLREGRLHELDALVIAKDLCDGLRALAARGVVHGGLHPGNVIIQREGGAKITDFCVSRACLCQQTSRSYPIGALRYAAPEQWLGGVANAVTDIYSLGLLLSLLKHGGEMFGHTEYQQLEQAVTSGAVSQSPVIAGAVHRDPSRRFQDVDEIRKRLEQLWPPPPATTQGSNGPRNAASKGSALPKPPKLSGPSLKGIVHFRSGIDLLARPPGPPWPAARSVQPEQHPLRLESSGEGVLDLSVAGYGDGIIVSPEKLSLLPGQVYWVMITVAPDAADFANVLFRWVERGAHKEFQLRLDCRATAQIVN